MIDKEELIQKALKVIKKQDLTFVAEISKALGVARKTLYNKKITEDERIIDAIEDNKMSVVKKLKDKWMHSDNPTLQIALMKMVCSDEIADRINGTKQKIEANLNTPSDIRVNIVKIRKEDLEKERQEQSS